MLSGIGGVKGPAIKPSPKTLEHFYEVKIDNVIKPAPKVFFSLFQRRTLLSEDLL